MSTKTRTAEEMVRDGLKTVPEAAEFTRLSRAMLYTLMADGALAYTRIGKRRLIPKTALVDLAARNLHGGQQE